MRGGRSGSSVAAAPNPASRLAAALFPQHTKHSGVAAVLKAADQITAHTSGRDQAIFAELDAIDQADEWEDN